MGPKANEATSFTVGSLAFVLVAALEMTISGEVLGQVSTVEHAQLEAQASRTASFDIPVQPLGQALTAFGRQSGLQIALDAASAAGKTSSSISGAMTVERALRLLLAGTGVSYRFTSDNAVAVSSAPDASGVMQLDPVQVQGAFPVPSQAMIDNLPPPYAGGQVGTGAQLGLLGNRNVMAVPFNITSYTAKQIQDEQARSVRDVLADDPSVRELWPNGSNSFASVNIRGFDVGSNDVAYGGLFGILPEWTVAAELAERVEVLKGPSAFLNGMPPSGAIGGTINVVPKRATDLPITQLTASYVSVGQFGGALDVGRRFGPDKQFGVRFNGVYRDGETAVQWNKVALGLGVLGVDFRGDRVRFSADVGFQDQRINGLVSFPHILSGVPVPSAPDASKTFGQPWTWAQHTDFFVVVRGEVDVTKGLTAYAALGAKDDRNMSFTARSALLAPNGSLRIEPFTSNTFTMSQTAEAGLRGTAETGPIAHALNFNTTTLRIQRGAGFNFGASFASNMYSPTFMSLPGVPYPPAPKTNDGNLTSVAFSDTLSAFNERIQLMLGSRQQFISSTNYSNNTGSWTSSYSASALSPSVALLVKPWQNVSIYGNYIEGLKQGAVVGPTFTNAGEVFPPFKSKQYEAGVKVDWGSFATTLSAFQITQRSEIVDSARNILTVDGEQRNRGIEFNTFGELTKGIRLLGGVMFLNAVLAKTANGLQDGWRASGSPDFRLNLGGEWDTPFVRGLTLNGRVIYTSSQYVGVDSPRRSIPDWTRVDVGARYTFDRADGKPLTLRFNVENVFDTNYWSAVGSGIFLMEGAPRTFLVSLSAAF